MEESAYLGGVIVGLGYFAAGVRLAWLSASTRKAPERLLSATFLLWGLAYAWQQMPLILQDEALLVPFYTAGRVFTDAGTIGSAFFLRLVFRPSSTIAMGVVAGICGGLALGIAGSCWTGDWGGMDPLHNYWWWLEWSAVVVSVCWIGVEGFHHYGMSKRRRRLGLCGALDCNRYLLWGLVGAVWMIYELAYAAQQLEFQLIGAFSTSLDRITAVLESTPIVFIWLIFCPPRAYQRWIERSDPHPNAAEG